MLKNTNCSQAVCTCFALASTKDAKTHLLLLHCILTILETYRGGERELYSRFHLDNVHSILNPQHFIPRRLIPASKFQESPPLTKSADHAPWLYSRYWNVTDVIWRSDAGELVDGNVQLNKNGVPRKRNRVIVACVPCRSRKLKCDLTQPCESCMKRRDGVVCVYDSPLLPPTATSRRRGGKNKKSSEDRLKALEELVTHIVGGPSPPAHFSGAVSEGTGQEDSTFVADLLIMAV